MEFSKERLEVAFQLIISAEGGYDLDIDTRAHARLKTSDWRYKPLPISRRGTTEDVFDFLDRLDSELRRDVVATAQSLCFGLGPYEMNMSANRLGESYPLFSDDEHQWICIQLRSFPENRNEGEPRFSPKELSEVLRELLQRLTDSRFVLKW